MAPPATATTHDFKDGHFGVKFQVPAGWSLNRKDGVVSTFHNDARSASAGGQGARHCEPGLQSLSVLDVERSGVLLQRDAALERRGVREGGRPENVPVTVSTDVQDIGGMRFTHGHDEHGEICVEARDEVYTAYRKGSCYRFDMEINTFCAISSGAQEITERQLQSLNQRMADILSTVTLEWTKTAAHPVPAPEPPVMVQRPAPKPESKPVADPRSAIAQR